MRRLLLLLVAGCQAPAKDPVGDDAPEGDSDTWPAETDDTEVPDPPDTEAPDTEAPDTDDTAAPTASRIEVTATADDAWELWIDGRRARLPDGATAWWEVNTFAVTRPGTRHVVAIRARDTQEVVAGLLAEVVVNGEVVARTGDFGFVATGTQPPTGWTERAFDDSGWTPPPVCAPEDQAVWGRITAAHGALLDAGAEWVWARPCRGDLGGTWFRVVIGPRSTP